MNNLITIPSLTKHTHTLIFLHGLGDTGAGWSSTFQYFHKHFSHYKLVFPTAPKQPVTINGGMKMNSWYDIKTMDIGGSREVDVDGLNGSKRLVEDLIAKEVDDGIPSKHVVIGGFSQGGAVTLHTLLNTDVAVCAGVVLSSYMPTEPAKVNFVNKDVKVFMAHGTADPVVNYQYGKMSYEKLKQFMTKPEFHTYEGMGHSSDEAELLDLFRFMQG